MKRGGSVRIWAAVLFLSLGLALLATFAAAHIDSYLHSRAALGEFGRQHQFAEPLSTAVKASEAGAQPEPGEMQETGSAAAHPDPKTPGAAIAVLSIPKIHLEVPVLEGTAAVTLNRGVGWIDGTAMPGEHGNTGIAGHRDSFFRGLKKLTTGDTIILDTRQGSVTYVVDSLQIVAPESTSVLNPTTEPTLTLVTCYPFNFVGSAPERYIVTAHIDSRNPNP